MNGSLQIRNGRYQMVLELGNGKQKWISTRLPINGNKRKAEKMLQDTLREYEDKMAQEAVRKNSVSDMAITDLIKDYLVSKKRTIRANSFTSYLDTATLHIIPYFEELGLMVHQMGPVQVQRYYNAKTDEGLSPETLTRHRTILRGALDYAIQTLGIISVNVADRVKLPRKATKRIPTFYNANQLKQLFKAVESESIEAPVILSATYGFRRSEVLGLKWSAIDWENGTICVQHTVTRDGKNVVRDDTVKEAASYRTMPFTDDIRAFLKRLYAHHKQMKRLCGKEFDDSDYICIWDDGKPLEPDYVTSRFGRFLKRKKLPHIRFHDLRHSAATVLARNGFTLQQIQRWLGHASIRSTERYAHSQADDKKDMANAIGKLLSFKNDTKGISDAF